MGNTRQNKHSTSQDDFDLDQYLEEQANPQAERNQNHFQPNRTGPKKWFKNTVLTVAALSMTFLWYHDWNPRQAIGTLLEVGESNGITVTTDGGARIEIEIPDIQIPDITFPGSNEAPMEFNTDLGISYTAYLEALNEAEILDNLGGSSITMLYQNGVPVDYINEFKTLNLLDEFGGTSISRFYQNEVPTDYIEQYATEGLMTYLGGTSITQLYQNEVPIEYVLSLNEAGLLDQFGGTSITRLYERKVSIDYINELSAANMLDKFGSSSIVRLHNNSVPISFLQDLKNRDLLDNMTTQSVIDAYRIDGN